jgi:hypothetical protein
VIRNFKIESLDHWSGLILGGSGAGKTTLIGTIPEGQRVLIVSAENGLLAIRDMLLRRRKEVSAVTIENYEDFQKTVDQLSQPKGMESFDWIVFDSLTEIGEQCLAHMTKTHGSTTWKRYEALGNEMIANLKRIRDMKSYTSLFTCLVTTAETKDKERVLVPQFPGNVVKDSLMAIFDEVLYITSKTARLDGTRCIYTDSFEGYPAKDRSGRLDYEERPDLGLISAKILAPVGAGDEPRPDDGGPGRN